MSEFSDYVAEVLQPFGAVRCRRMFGGYGVYRDGLMFALIADDVLYLKADAESAGAFAARGLGRFEYHRGGKPVRMSYYLAPEEIYDDPAAALQWARLAWGAALRSGAARGAGPGRS